MFYHPHQANLIVNSLISGLRLKPEFRAGADPITILVVAPRVRSLSWKPRSDPLFPSNDAYGNGPKRAYTNNSTRGNAMGCVDYIKVCNMHEDVCWDNSNLTQAIGSATASTARNALFLLLYGLERSNAYFSMAHNTDLLNATTSSMLFYQDRLHEEQWKVEAEVLFQLSLARITIDIFDLARGTYKNFNSSGAPGQSYPLIDRLPKEFHGVCNMFAFHAEGYTNANAIGFWGINVLCVLMFFASRRCSSKEQDGEGGPSTNTTGKHGKLWISVALQAILERWLPFILICLYQGMGLLIGRTWSFAKSIV